MNAFGSLQNTLLLILGVLAVGAEIFALVDAVRHRPDAYVAASKRTKPFWTIVLAVALAVGIITIFNVLNFVGLIAFVGAAVYLTDVRPALRRVSGKASRRGPQDSPYGPW